MKKFKVFLMLTALMVLISGCGGKETQTPNQNNENNNSAVSETVVITPQELPENVLNWHEVSRYTGDTDGDGIDENVVLATSAEYDEDGEFFWNDGQSWALYVDDRDEDYLLFNEYLNAGSVYFEVVDYYMEDGAEPKINVMTSASAGFALKSYGFSEKDGGYAETVIYDTVNVTKGGINRRFSTIPEY